jgi:CheY-like chemotaxis protein
MDSDTPIDLLFTDVIMPGAVKGRELSIRAAQRVPPLPVLLASGYTRDEVVRDGRLPAGVTLLGKPYRRDDLAHLVRSVLDSHRGAQKTTPAPVPAALARASTAPHADIGVARTASPTLLLVEDDAASREAMHELLTRFGLHCTAAANAEDALALASTRPFHVLLADLTLPGQSGAELARALVRRQPTMQVILMSGYGTHAEIGEPIAGAQLLGKPVDLSALQQALAPWLSAGRPHGATHVA